MQTKTIMSYHFTFKGLGRLSSSHTFYPRKHFGKQFRDLSKIQCGYTLYDSGVNGKTLFSGNKRIWTRMFIVAIYTNEWKNYDLFIKWMLKAIKMNDPGKINKPTLACWRIWDHMEQREMSHPNKSHLRLATLQQTCRLRIDSWREWAQVRSTQPGPDEQHHPANLQTHEKWNIVAVWSHLV